MVGSFNLAKYETSNAQYASFLNANQVPADGLWNGKRLVNSESKDLQVEFQDGVWKSKKRKEHFPMVMVSYYGAKAFCEWARGSLPTEAEWIYAAKGGIKSKKFLYSGGNNLGKLAWYKGNCNAQLHAVGQKTPNELGIYDMSGNVWEWCLNEKLTNESDSCIHMGGSWFTDQQPCQILSRYGNTPTHFSNSVGYRVKYQIPALGDYKGVPFSDSYIS